jgi:uncharacterized tellurite resistance protein B-like protein
MIRILTALFEQPRKENEATQQRTLRMAAAALLVETARADFSEDAAELARLSELLATALQLNKAEVHKLVLAAQERVEEATSLYEFTRVINDHCSAEQKLQLVGAMWHVAYADGDADKYEEHLIRQVADLIYIPHSDYIRCKLAARG